MMLDRKFDRARNRIETLVGEVLRSQLVEERVGDLGYLGIELDDSIQCSRRKFGGRNYSIRRRRILDFRHGFAMRHGDSIRFSPWNTPSVMSLYLVRRAGPLPTCF